MGNIIWGLYYILVGLVICIPAILVKKLWGIGVGLITIVAGVFMIVGIIPWD